MRIDIAGMQDRYVRARAGRASGRTAGRRLRPSLFQYDYLTLSSLSRDVGELLRRAPATRPGARALDLGSSHGPYHSLLEASGYYPETLDLTREEGADHQGTIEATGMPDATFDLVLCTQVLEHCLDPWQGVSEICRVLRPGGYAILTVPHVWFYHPHPHDNWRFTQEGLVHLCRRGGLVPEVLLAQGGTTLTAAQVAAFLTYGAFGKWGAPVYAALNLLGRAGDRLTSNELFCINFACLARRA